MSGVLIFILVIGALVGLRYALSKVWGAVETGIDVAGGALGEALRPDAPPAPPAPQGVVTLTRAAGEIRAELVSAGSVDPRAGRLVTAAGVTVDLTPASSPARLECRWDQVAAVKSTVVMADVLRSVRQVDPGAEVVLWHRPGA